MPTEGEIIPIERDIQQLLNETTYQGMTDSEIQKIIDYRVSIAIMQAEGSYLVSSSRAILQQLLAINEVESREALDVLQSHMNNKIEWNVHPKEGTVNSNV